MADPVLDASAILAMLRGELGGDRVVELMGQASVSTVNLAEVTARLTEFDPDNAAFRALGLLFNVSDFDTELAIDAGLLRTTTRSQGLSLGDRACLALARREDAPVWTTDKAWANIDVGVEVVLIR